MPDQTPLPPAWKDIASHPDYQALAPEAKTQVLNSYLESYGQAMVAGGVKEEEIPAALQEIKDAAVGFAEPDMPTSDKGPAEAPLFQGDMAFGQEEIQRRYEEHYLPAQQQIMAAVGDRRLPLDKPDPAVDAATQSFGKEATHLRKMYRALQEHNAAANGAAPNPIYFTNGGQIVRGPEGAPWAPPMTPDEFKAADEAHQAVTVKAAADAEAERQKNIKILGHEPGFMGTAGATIHGGLMDLFGEVARTFQNSNLYSPAAVQENITNVAHDDAVIAGLGHGAPASAGRGLGNFLTLVAGNPAGKAGLAIATLRGAVQTRARVYDATGNADLADKEALKTIPELGVFMIAGAAVGQGIGGMLPAETGAMAKGLAEYAGAQFTNVGVSNVLAALNNRDYSLDNFMADTLFAALHGIGAYGGVVDQHARERAHDELVARGFTEAQLQDARAKADAQLAYQQSQASPELAKQWADDHSKVIVPPKLQPVGLREEAAIKRRQEIEDVATNLRANAAPATAAAADAGGDILKAITDAMPAAEPVRTPVPAPTDDLSTAGDAEGNVLAGLERRIKVPAPGDDLNTAPDTEGDAFSNVGKKPEEVDHLAPVIEELAQAQATKTKLSPAQLQALNNLIELGRNDEVSARAKEIRKTLPPPPAVDGSSPEPTPKPAEPAPAAPTKIDTAPLDAAFSAGEIAHQEALAKDDPVGATIVESDLRSQLEKLKDLPAEQRNPFAQRLLALSDAREAAPSVVPSSEGATTLDDLSKEGREWISTSATEEMRRKFYTWDGMPGVDVDLAVSKGIADGLRSYDPDSGKSMKNWIYQKVSQDLVSQSRAAKAAKRPQVSASLDAPVGEEESGDTIGSVTSDPNARIPGVFDPGTPVSLAALDRAVSEFRADNAGDPDKLAALDYYLSWKRTGKRPRAGGTHNYVKDGSVERDLNARVLQLTGKSPAPEGSAQPVPGTSRAGRPADLSPDELHPRERAALRSIRGLTDEEIDSSPISDLRDLLYDTKTEPAAAKNPALPISLEQRAGIDASLPKDLTFKNDGGTQVDEAEGQISNKKSVGAGKYDLSPRGAWDTVKQALRQYKGVKMAVGAYDEAAAYVYNAGGDNAVVYVNPARMAEMLNDISNPAQRMEMAQRIAFHEFGHSGTFEYFRDQYENSPADKATMADLLPDSPESERIMRFIQLKLHAVDQQLTPKEQSAVEALYSHEFEDGPRGAVSRASEYLRMLLEVGPDKRKMSEEMLGWRQTIMESARRLWGSIGGAVKAFYGMVRRALGLTGPDMLPKNPINRQLVTELRDFVGQLERGAREFRAGRVYNERVHDLVEPQMSAARRRFIERVQESPNIDPAVKAGLDPERETKPDAVREAQAMNFFEKTGSPMEATRQLLGDNHGLTGDTHVVALRHALNFWNEEIGTAADEAGKQRAVDVTKKIAQALGSLSTETGRELRSYRGWSIANALTKYVGEVSKLTDLAIGDTKPLIPEITDAVNQVTTKYVGDLLGEKGKVGPALDKLSEGARVKKTSDLQASAAKTPEQRAADRLLKKFAAAQADPQIWATKNPKAKAAVELAVNDALKAPALDFNVSDFALKVQGHGVDAATAFALANTVSTEIISRDHINFERDRQKQEQAALDELQRPEKTAQTLVEKYAKSQSDTLAWPDAKKPGDPVRKALAEHLRLNLLTEESFARQLTELGVSGDTAKVLAAEATREIGIAQSLKAERAKQAREEFADNFWDRAPEIAGRRMAGLLAEAEPADAARVHADKLSALFAGKLKEMLPEDKLKAAKPKITAVDAIKAAMVELPELRQAWEAAKEEFINSLGDNFGESTRAIIDEMADAALETPYTNAQFENGVREILRTFPERTTLRDIVAKGLTQVDALGQTITDKLTEAGVDPAAAAGIEKSIRADLDRMTSDVKRREIDRVLKANPKEGKAAKKVRSAVDQIIRDSNLGVLDDQSAYEAIAEKRGLPSSFDPAVVDEIRRRVQAIETLIREGRRGFQVTREERSLLDYIATKLHQKHFLPEALGSIFRGHIFSGLWARAKDVLSNTLWAPVVGAENLWAHHRGLNPVIRTIRTAADIPKAVGVWSMGVLHGLVDAAYTMTTGFRPNEAGEISKSGGWLERQELRLWKQEFTKIATYLKLPFLPSLVFSKYVMRFIGAMDAPFATAHRHVSNWLAARDIAEAEFPDDAIAAARRARTILGHTPAIRQAAEAQATREDLKGLEHMLRTSEILEQRLPEEAQHEAHRVAANATFTGPMDPNSFFGWLGLSLNRLTQNLGDYSQGDSKTRKVVQSIGGLAASTVVPVVKTIVNVVNANISMTPLAYWGILRSRPPERVSDRAAYEKGMTKRHFRAAMGTTALLALSMLHVASRKWDDENAENKNAAADRPWWWIRARGQGDPDPNKQYQQLAEKVMPYSIELRNGVQLPTTYSPFAFIEGIAGDFMDYKDSESERHASSISVIGQALLRQSVHTVEMSPARSLVDFASALTPQAQQQPGSKTKVFDRFIRSVVGAFVEPSLMREFRQQSVDAETKDPQTIRQSIESRMINASNNPEIPDKLNKLGEEYVRRPSDLLWMVHQPAPVWDFIEKSGLTIPPYDARIDLGDRVMTPKEREQYIRESGTTIKNWLLSPSNQKILGDVQSRLGTQAMNELLAEKVINPFRNAAKSKIRGAAAQAGTLLAPSPNFPKDLSTREGQKKLNAPVHATP